MDYHFFSGDDATMIHFAIALAATAAWVLVLGVLLLAFPRKIKDILARAPGLDLIASLFSWVPWLICGIRLGWLGLIGSIIGNIVGAYLWIFVHEALHRDAVRGPRIVKVLNRTVGRFRNHAALLFTLIALPGFWIVRLHEIFVYPSLILLLNFPKYHHGEWVNVSRQKFEGLVGHDLIWCLYCDWMTGVYCLGAEMLRNVESFWCPIRFYDGKKCENCKADFPDIDGGWVSPTGSMKDVAQVVEQMYGDGRREWFGHPARLTVRGKDLAESSNQPAT